MMKLNLKSAKTFVNETTNPVGEKPISVRMFGVIYKNGTLAVKTSEYRQFIPRYKQDPNFKELIPMREYADINEGHAHIREYAAGKRTIDELGEMKKYKKIKFNI